MKKQTNEIKHYFREILGALSINEIMANEKLSQRVERIERLILKTA